MSDTVYRNVFKEIGKTDEEIAARLDDIVEQFFYGEDSFYHTAENDTGYFEDTGNHDARTEGMSYGMMMAVQLDKKDIFDGIWKWSKVNMFMTEGDNEGYFRWSCGTDGKSFADGPAPDGEEFYAMALFFAAHRWGDGEGIFNYTHEAQEILRACLHKGENGRKGCPMWNSDNKLILFVPGIDFSDASYHLPHFYELFAKWAYEEDREFFAQAAKASRDYIAVSCHPVTGMNPEYGEFDGSPLLRTYSWFEERHDWFFSDSYRTAANIGLDRAWGGRDDRLVDAVKRLQYTLGVTNREAPFMIYEVDGTSLGEVARHPVGMLATTAQADAEDEAVRLAAEWVERLWNEPLRKGERRYYDNCLYMFAYLALSGNYRIW